MISRRQLRDALETAGVLVVLALFYLVVSQ
jgi:hypothetical protein